MITLTTPFAGKKHCFEKYYQAILKMKDQIDNVIWYDNSNDKEFGEMLKDKIKVFPKYKIVVDKIPPKVVENTTDYAQICDRVRDIYRNIGKLIPIEGFMFNVEDDVEIPPDSLKKMLKIFDDKKVGTVIGCCHSRRLYDRDKGATFPISWNFIDRRTFPPPDTSEERETETKLIKKEKKTGIDIIGSGHMGVWLTPCRIVHSIGFGEIKQGLTACDIIWGYDLKTAGFNFVIDWSIKTKHHWELNGERGYY